VAQDSCMLLLLLLLLLLLWTPLCPVAVTG
jgi:hypothetical protein